jgi:O-acetyl-ADP-ribose deacetylase (regulator of RNase III)
VFSEQTDRSALLESCYRNALGVADEIGAQSVAFPAVSAGVYGWPMASAADIAIATVRATPTRVEDIRFVLVTQSAYDEFDRALHKD